MKTTGITRRIDELGRIVIPKEIRNNLHIKSGELMEIYLSDLDTITLRKHNIITGEETFIKNYVNHLATTLKSMVYLVSLSEVLFVSKKETEKTSLLPQTEEIFVDGIENIKRKDSITLCDGLIIKQPFYVFPLAPNGDLLGYLIIENDKGITDSDTLISFSISLLNDYLENN